MTVEDQQLADLSTHGHTALGYCNMQMLYTTFAKDTGMDPDVFSSVHLYAHASGSSICSDNL